MRPMRPLVALFLPLILAVPAAGSVACEQETLLDACELWTARFNSATPAVDDIEADFGNDIALSADGATAFVTGRIRGLANADDFDVGTIAYDTATGAQRWFARYAGGTYYDFGQAVALDPDGERVYVAGARYGANFDTVVLAYAATSGALLWQAVVDGDGADDLATAIDVSDDGNALVVAAESATVAGNGAAESLDMLLLALDPQTGEERWRARHDAGGQDRPGAVAIGPDTRVDPEDPGPAVVVVGGSAREGEPAALATLAFDLETGEPRWQNRIEAPTGHEGRDVAITPGGERVVVVGNRAGTGNNLWDYVTASYDLETGDERWAEVFDSASNSLDQASDLVLSPDGTRAFVTGVSWEVRMTSPLYVFDADYLTLAYDVAAGEELWRSTYDGGHESDDVGTTIGVSPDGATIYVSGHSRIPGVWTYATVALESGTGARRWSARLGGLDGVSAQGPVMAVAPSGRLVISGAALGKDWYDVFTVAYDG